MRKVRLKIEFPYIAEEGAPQRIIRQGEEGEIVGTMSRQSCYEVKFPNEPVLVIARFSEVEIVDGTLLPAL